MTNYIATDDFPHIVIFQEAKTEYQAALNFKNTHGRWPSRIFTMEELKMSRERIAKAQEAFKEASR